MYDPIFHDLPPRDAKVWAVSDVHVGSAECDLEGFGRFVEGVASRDDEYVVLCGDLINNGIKSSRTNTYDEVLMPSQQIETVVELLRPLADGGKILGVVGGNHEARTIRECGVDPTLTICSKLGVESLYRRDIAFVRVRLNGNIVSVHNLMLVHGSTANKKRKFVYSLEGVDVVFSGHTHDGIVEKPARLVFTAKGGVHVKEIVSITATSWLRYGGYGAAAMYLPKKTSDPQAVILHHRTSRQYETTRSVVW